MGKNEFSQECVILKMPEGCQSRWAEAKWVRENKNQERDLHRQTELSWKMIAELHESSKHSEKCLMITEGKTHKELQSMP